MFRYLKKSPTAKVLCIAAVLFIATAFVVAAYQSAPPAEIDSASSQASAGLVLIENLIG